MNNILPFKAVRAVEDKVGLFVTRNYQSYNAVSYTHLTLPTKRIV